MVTIWDELVACFKAWKYHHTRQPRWTYWHRFPLEPYHDWVDRADLSERKPKFDCIAEHMLWCDGCGDRWQKRGTSSRDITAVSEKASVYHFCPSCLARYKKFLEEKKEG